MYQPSNNSKFLQSLSIAFLILNQTEAKEYLEMTGDDESSLLATRHVEAKLLFRRQSKEFPSEASHIRYEICVDAMIHHLENSPVLTRLHNLPTYLRPPAFGFVDSGQRNYWNLIAELVVRHLGTLIFVPDKALLKSLLLYQCSQC